MKNNVRRTLPALRNGANVKGYFAWCFMDVFEYLSGFMSRYGLYRVDFEDEALPSQALCSLVLRESEFLKKEEIQIREENELDDAGSHAQQ
ncbi:LOW QUALITY PROTEIN: hypothetical protein SETIT_5G356700v2 [Setaria italica]|uniref:4-hydroxy-7-methoxy-3-oxo-3,4-dihydro-2H-1,4-benzoxazin-2-yl glucosidebeta-D-glucosidase n=1 Tax=Setaria italica TaxID=4555 RepID=A0A368RC89_SETIT|nr:LOW QUALITY PROTEIN: hypothetical protein SETIT_5G356700v2 [Setaria italica]